MKILFISSQFPPFIGGVSWALYRVACGLAQQGNDVSVVTRDRFDSTTPPNHVGIREDCVDRLRVFYLPNSAFTAAGAAFGVNLVRDIAARCQPQIVHSYFFSITGYFGQVAAHSAGAPHVTSCRGNDCTKNILLKTGHSRLALRSADYVIGVSRSMLRWASIVANGQPRAFVPNSVSPDFFAAGDCPREAAREEWRLSEDTLALGAIFRPFWKKGVDYLQGLLAELGRSDLPSIRFTLVGTKDPTLVECLRSSLVDRALPSGQRTFESHESLSRDQLPTWLAALDLFVMTSRREGMPNALLESLACGTPVASTAVDGVVDILQGERVGLLLNPFDVSKSTDEIISLLKDPHQLSTMRKCSRELIRDKYLLEHEIDALLGIYHSLLKPRLRQRTAQ